MRALGRRFFVNLVGDPQVDIADDDIDIRSPHEVLHDLVRLRTQAHQITGNDDD